MAALSVPSVASSGATLLVGLYDYGVGDPVPTVKVTVTPTLTVHTVVPIDPYMWYL